MSSGLATVGDETDAGSEWSRNDSERITWDGIRDRSLIERESRHGRSGDSCFRTDRVGALSSKAVTVEIASGRSTLLSKLIEFLGRLPPKPHQTNNIVTNDTILRFQSIASTLLIEFEEGCETKFAHPPSINDDSMGDDWFHLHRSFVKWKI
jgi:hypothetical protein